MPIFEEVTSLEEYFEDTFSNGTANYFNHESTDQAVYELSQYFNLLNSLRWYNHSSCHKLLVFLLCHLHLPRCPRQQISEETCQQTLSSCSSAIQKLNESGGNFTWPPVKVDCKDKKWFSDTSVLDSYGFSTRRVPPAPTRIKVTSQYSPNLNIIFQRIGGLNATALYRAGGTTQPYQYVSSSLDSISLSKLTPATDYEILLASLTPRSGFPGAFVNFKSNTFGYCPNDTTGEEVAQGKFFWKVENGSTWQNASCPYGTLTSSDEEAVRFCKCDVHNVCKRPFWLEPKTNVCKFKVINDSEVTASLSRIFQMLTGDETSRQNASEQLVAITSKRAPEFEEDDVILSTLILEDLVRGAKDLSKTGSNIVKTVNSILNAKSSVVSESQRSSNTSARVIQLIEEYLDNVPLQNGKSLTQNEPNIAIHVEEFDVTDFEGAGAASITNGIDNFVAYDNQTEAQSDIAKVSITLPHTLFKNVDTKFQNQRISFVTYRSTSFFTTSNQSKSDLKADTIRKKNSFVISGSVKDQRLTNLVDPVVTTYQPLKEGIDETTGCVFWNFTQKKGSGDWSSEGCSYNGTRDGLVTCQCTHLTNFAILMDVHIDDRNEAHDKALSIISYVGCAISMVGLILTIITILIFKDLRSKAPTQILLNFCVALSLALIVFLAAAERSKTSSLAACRAAAIALHYFVLAMFTWTSINAYNMYLAFVKVMPTYHSKFMLKCCVAGWGLPAVIVLITAAASIEKYGDENFCRVNGLAFQLGFLTPVLIILLLNSIAFVLIIRSLLKAGTKVTADKRATGLQQARRGAAILVVLGLTWLFGVLAIGDAKLVFQYLFCIFNSIQGLLVFLFYCVLSAETKNKYRKLLLGKSKESTDTGKNRNHGISSEGQSHAIDINKKRTSDAFTTSAGGSSSLSALNKLSSETKL